MKIPIKSKEEIRIMVEGGKKLAGILRKVLSRVEPGVKLTELDQLAEKLIEKAGGRPSFKMVPNYHWATCININDGVVHGVPGPHRIKNGDLVSVDLGIFYQGFHADMARTIQVGKVAKVEKFLEAGKKALKEAAKVVKTGNRVGHISQVIEQELTENGFYPVKSLTGHGVGEKLHEPPPVPCFLKGGIKNSPLLKSRMVLAIEVIYTQKETELSVREDGWTVRTKDGSLAGLFENTILVGSRGGQILTQ